jgi:hypothetical protein
MKKTYILLSVSLIGIFINSICSQKQEASAQQLLSMIVSFHNNAFGVNHLFDQPIDNDKLTKWLEVGDAVKEYVLERSQDIFGKNDSLLIRSLNSIEKTNKALVDSIVTTYAIKDNTKNLIKMAQLFQTIETLMTKVITSLQNTKFILNKKKNAQKMLLALALFIETTAKKANKDTRMGHRTDISLPTAPTTSIPTQQTVPLLPPQDLPPIYEEEPTETPPTRPAPPVPSLS